MSQLVLLAFCIALVLSVAILIIKNGVREMKKPITEILQDNMQLIDEQVHLSNKDKETLHVESILNSMEDTEYRPAFLLLD